MKNISEIIACLLRMAALLRIGGEEGWAERLDQCRLALPRDTRRVLSEITRLYGGVGSLSDVMARQ